MPTLPQSTKMDQSYSIAIEGLNHVVPKWSNRSSKVGHLVFSLSQWCTIVAYQIPICYLPIDQCVICIVHYCIANVLFLLPQVMFQLVWLLPLLRSCQLCMAMCCCNLPVYQCSPAQILYFLIAINI